jgi:Peptidase family C25
MKKIFTTFLFSVCFLSLFAQMRIGNQTLYGNEWIDYSKPHVKFQVAEDALYRLSYADLVAAGWPASGLDAQQLRVYCLGEQVPVYLNFTGAMGNNDYIEFVGRKNRGTLDRYLWEPNKDGRINPEYSMFNDTAAYFVTVRNTGTPLRTTAHSNDLTNAPASETWMWSTAIDAPGAVWKKGRESQYVYYSWFNNEGFCTSAPAANIERIIQLPGLKQGVADAQFLIRYWADFQGHQIKTTVSDSVVSELDFNGAAVQKLDISLPTSRFANESATVKISALGTNDQAASGAIKVRYPRVPDAKNAAWLEIESAPGSGARYYEITGFNTAGGAVVVYDLTTNSRIEATIQGSVVKFITPTANTAHQLLLVNPTLFQRTLSSGKSVQFVDYLAQDANFLFIAHPKLRGQNGALDPVQLYADYRSSTDGGSYRTLIADINQLNDQYAYGVKHHPFSIRNFLHRYKNDHPQAETVMIMGKGLEYSAFRSTLQQQRFADTVHYIPTYGSPATDQMFVMGNSISKPIMAIGRVAATHSTQLVAYLDKVKQYESVQRTAAQTVEGKRWMKRILHLNGGGPQEISIIRSILDDFGNRARTNKFGADVRSYEGKSADPVLQSGFDQIQNLYQEGISLMTFMGHSSANIISFDIGSPSLYPVSGKYPIFAVMGCYSGSCSTVVPGVGEGFILEPNRCAIAYFASVSYGITSSLGEFGRQYYDLIGGDGYGHTQGWVLNKVVENLQGSQAPDMVGFLHQFQYQGDPAIKMNHSVGSDYTIDQASFQANPNPVSVEEPNYELAFDVVNLGQNIDSLITVKVLQQMPSDSVRLIMLDTIAAPVNTTHLQYTFPSPGERAVGFNRFFVEVDADQRVAELPTTIGEQNNKLLDPQGQPGTDVYFFSNDAKPIWPKEYSIVSEQNPTIYASTLSGIAPSQEFLLQMDTSAAFNSPVLKVANVTASGGLISWKPNITLLDSTVYFWRIARDTLGTSTIPWRNSSFTYIASSPDGWSQGHHQQFKNNQFEGMQIGANSHEVEFSDNAAYTFLDVGYRGLGVVYTGFNNHRSDHFTGDYGWGLRNTHQGMIVAVSDPVTGRYWVNPVGSSTNPSNQNLLYRVFDTRDSLKRHDAMRFLRDTVPAGYIVTLFMMSKILVDPNGGYGPEKWANDSIAFGTNLYQVLEAQGGFQVRALETLNNVPYGMIYRKDSPEPSTEVVVTSTTTFTEIRKDYFAKWDRGNMKSVIIGPATKWRSAHWRVGTKDHLLDESSLSIYQVKDGQPDTLVATILPGTPAYDLSQINAQDWPYLRLVYAALDTILFTATDMPQWRVLYDGIPEGAIVPASYLTFKSDTLEQGENVEIAIAFQNITKYPFDSLLVRIRNEDNNGSAQFTDQWLRPLPNNADTVVARATFSTSTMSGPQRLSVDFNYQNEQAELYHFNNTYIRSYYVQGDRINPALQVTFDGRQILNGDLVSPKPEIVIELKDENPRLAITDTASFKLFLRYPSGTEQQVYMSDPQVLFIPANLASGKNRATIEYRPDLTEDGTYTLRVNGRDASGNQSSGLEYRIQFEVINKSSLSNVLNYPNPFSTSTCFVYTLTGIESPDQLMLRVMTVSGRVVREVTAAEFGTMRTGTHMSDFCWDGKDQFGDQLANGVYYYQVFAKKANGEPFELYQNSQADGFFKNGIGKMVLMR